MLHWGMERQQSCLTTLSDIGAPVPPTQCRLPTVKTLTRKSVDSTEAPGPLNALTWFPACKRQVDAACFLNLGLQ